MAIAQTAYEQTLETVLESIEEGYVVIDREWRFAYVNRKAEEFLGLKRSVLLGKDLRELFSAQLSHGPAFGSYEKAMATGEAQTVEYISPIAGKWIRARIVPGPEGLTVFFNDTTDRQNSLQSARFLEGITDAVTDALIGTDMEFRIMSWNAAAEKLYGWTREEVMGKPAGEIIPTKYTEITSDFFQALLKDGRWKGEVIQQTKDGKDLRIMAVVTALKNPQGDLIGAVACNRDISDAKTAEEAQMRLAAIVESSDDAIMSKDLDGIIRSWNKGAEKIFGYTAIEAIGQHVTFLMPEELRHEESSIIRKIKNGEQISHYETERVTKHGKRIAFRLPFHR